MINEHIVNIYDEDKLQKEETMRKIGISDLLKKPLKNIFDSEELDEKSVCREFRHTANDGRTHLTTIEMAKKLAAYHQYYAVNKAVERTTQTS